MAANRFEGGVRSGAFPKILQCVQEDFNILDQPHLALVLVHAFEMRVGIFFQKRMCDLDEVTKFFEDDSQAVDRGGLRRVHLPVRLHRPQVGVVHRFEQARLKALAFGIFPNRNVNLFDAFVQVGRFRFDDLFARLTQQSFLAIQQPFLERFQFGKIRHRLRSIHEHHLHVAQVVEFIELIFQGAPRFLNARMRVERAQQVQHCQQAARRHAQVVDRLLRKFAFAHFQLRAIFFPAFIERIRQEIWFCHHGFLSVISSPTPKISSKRARRLFNAHFSSMRSPLPYSTSSQFFFFSLSATLTTRAE